MRTLTGKEIELDIEPDYKVSQHNPPNMTATCPMVPTTTTATAFAISLSRPLPTVAAGEDDEAVLERTRVTDAQPTGVAHQGARGGKRGHPARPAETDFRRQANVRFANPDPPPLPSETLCIFQLLLLVVNVNMNQTKQ